MIIHQKGDVVELKGALDANHWLALKSVVSLQLQGHPLGIVIDGRGLTEINEAGAQTFTDASEFIQAHNARVVVAGLSPQIIEEIRHIPGARSQLPLAASVEEARASLVVGGIEAVPEAKRKPAVLVPLLGEWRKAVDYAAVYADRATELHLLYVIEVPRAQPLGVPLPEKEHDAAVTLDEAEKELGRRGFTVRRMITRARIAVEGVAKFASDTNPRLVVAAYSKSELQRGGEGHDVIATLAGDSPGNVIIYCVNDSRLSDEPCKTTILVPLFGAWMKAVDLAGEYASELKRDLSLLYVTQVPRISPLDIALPDKDREAQQTLAEAERIARKFKLPVRKATSRARDAVEGAGKFAGQTRPELVALAYYKEDLLERGARYAIVSTLCNEAPCDVAIYCAKSD